MGTPHRYSSKREARKAVTKEKNRIKKEKVRKARQKQKERKQRAEREAKKAAMHKSIKAYLAGVARAAERERRVAQAELAIKRAQKEITWNDARRKWCHARRTFYKLPLCEILAKLEALRQEVQPVSTGRADATGFTVPEQERTLSESAKKHQALFAAAAKTDMHA